MLRQFAWLLAVLSVIAGCKTSRQIRDPEYAQLDRSVRRASYIAAPEVEAVAPSMESLEGAHPVETYVQVALSQNPEVQAARKRVEAAAYRVPVAASLPDPTLNLTLQPQPVQTAAGKQELILAANQQVPWFGKLATQADVASAATDVARANLAATELSVITKVKKAYYELHYLQQAISVTESEKNLFDEIRGVAISRYQSNQTNQQDVLRSDLEIASVENDLIKLKQRLRVTQTQLAQLLHVAPQSNLRVMEELPQQSPPQDLERLQQTAVAARPELHAKLAAIRRDQHAVALARLDYKPNLTFGFSWIDVADQGISAAANGEDAFLITTGVNLPIYKKRLNASVKAAEAKAVSTAREYDSLRDNTLAKVTELLTQAHSQQELRLIYEQDILPKARQTVEVSIRAYNVGEVDFLMLLDNWRQHVRHELSYLRLDTSLRQSIVDLEQAVGGMISQPLEPMSDLNDVEILPPTPAEF